MDKPPNKKVERGQATRERIIDVGIRLFAEHGYEGTSIEAVLRESGVSRGALYHHFTGKDALFDAVLEQVETNIAGQGLTVDPAPQDAVSLLRAGCLAWVRLARDPVVQRIVLIDAPAVVGWHRWREIEERYAFGMVKKTLQAVADEGRLPREMVDFFAHMLLASMNEIALVIARAEDGDAAIRQGEAAVEELLSRLFSTTA